MCDGGPPFRELEGEGEGRVLHSTFFLFLSGNRPSKHRVYPDEFLRMINTTEQEEREYLELIKEKLLLAIRRTDDSVKQFSAELRQNKEYIHEHQSGMDEADMVAAGQS